MVIRLSLMTAFSVKMIAVACAIASPISVPAWQPWVGLALVTAAIFLAVWAGGRLFRVAILMQGTPPKIGNLLQWIVKG